MHVNVMYENLKLFFNIEVCDGFSHYKLTDSERIFIISWCPVRHHSLFFVPSVTSHSITNFNDISVKMANLQNYIQVLLQGIYVKIISDYRLRR